MDNQPPVQSDRGERELTERIVEEVADREGVDPLGLQPPLYSVVDPDALERLVQVPNWDGIVRFSYRGYEITVSHDKVSVDGGR